MPFVMHALWCRMVSELVSTLCLAKRWHACGLCGMFSSSACRCIQTCVHFVRTLDTRSRRLPGGCIGVRPWELCRQFPCGGYVLVLRGSSVDGISAWRLSFEFRIASRGCTLLARQSLCSCMYQILYSVAPCVTSIDWLRICSMRTKCT